MPHDEDTGATRAERNRNFLDADNTRDNVNLPVHSVPQLSQEDLVVLISGLQSLVHDRTVLVGAQVRHVNTPQLAALLEILVEPGEVKETFKFLVQQAADHIILVRLLQSG